MEGTWSICICRLHRLRRGLPGVGWGRVVGDLATNLMAANRTGLPALTMPIEPLVQRRVFTSNVIFKAGSRMFTAFDSHQNGPPQAPLPLLRYST